MHETFELIVKIIAILMIVITLIWAFIEYRENKKFIKYHKDFIDRKKREWNEYVDEILSENKGNDHMEAYIKEHFKKFFI